MTDYEELIEQLADRLSYWKRRMAIGGRRIQFEPIPEPHEGVWAFLDADGSGCGARLHVHPQLPEELIDWVIVRALAQLMVHRLQHTALAAVEALCQGPRGGRDEGPTAADVDRCLWGSRIEKAGERVVQYVCDAVLRREHPFLVDAWFAMLLYED